MNRFKLIIMALCALFVGRLRQQFCSANATTEDTTATHVESISRRADATLTTKYLLVKKGSDNGHIAACGAADLPLGTCPDEPTAEDPVTVLLLGKGPTKKMIASEAMATIGVRVYAAASGKIALTGTVEVGVLLSTAVGDGNIVEVADYPPPSAPGVAQTSAVIISPIITTGLTASGSASNDFSASSGPFKTSTGQNTAGGKLALKVIATPVAAAGSSTSDAAALGSANIVAISSDSAAKGVKLLTGVAGDVIRVLNTSSTAAILYPATGGTINGLSANAGVLIPASKSTIAVCTAADTWTAFDSAAHSTAA